MTEVVLGVFEACHAGFQVDIFPQQAAALAAPLRSTLFHARLCESRLTGLVVMIGLPSLSRYSSAA